MFSRFDPEVCGFDAVQTARIEELKDSVKKTIAVFLRGKQIDKAIENELAERTIVYLADEITNAVRNVGFLYVPHLEWACDEKTEKWFKEKIDEWSADTLSWAANSNKPNKSIKQDTEEENE